MSKTDVSRSLVSWRRLKALCYKETLQIFRDPSSILIAFVLPVVLLFIFVLQRRNARFASFGRLVRGGHSFVAGHGAPA